MNNEQTNLINNMATVEEQVQTQYVDEFGNPIDPSLIDENGNYIGEQVVQYVDEFGNPIDPSLIDENGNYIGNQVAFDNAGQPTEESVQTQSINQTDVASQLTAASENTLTTTESASAHQMDDKELLDGMVTFDYNNIPITDIVNSIILDSINKGASDIHFDPFDDGIKIRLRIDGQLNDYSIVPLFVKKNMITRIKIISGMNITESRVPQDGAIRTELANKTIDLRVSCLPTNMGEKIVLRIMDYSMSASGIDALDFSENNLDKIKKMLALPNGIILVTGATGSGKSTTVYSMLQKLNVEGTNLVTVEDPIEMSISGINQVQANSEIGLSFATVLRSILRQDPDVIMIGEIRDDETARIAVRAAITGHLVLSTIHTNNSLNTIERLTDMSVERYLLGSALSGVVSQKLARRLCPECMRKRQTTDYEKDLFMKILNKEVNEISEPVGCPHCAKGYRGRIALQEVLLLNNSIKDAITKGASKAQLRSLVYGENGTTTMLQDGLEKVLENKTSFDEIIKLIDLEDDCGSGSQLGLSDQLEAAQMGNQMNMINPTSVNLGGNSPININISPEVLEGLKLAGLTKADDDDEDEEIVVKPVKKKKKKNKVIEFDTEELKAMLNDDDLETLPEDEQEIDEKLEILDIEQPTEDAPVIEETPVKIEEVDLSEDTELVIPEEKELLVINKPIINEKDVPTLLEELSKTKNQLSKKKTILRIKNIINELKDKVDSTPNEIEEFIKDVENKAIKSEIKNDIISHITKVFNLEPTIEEIIEIDNTSKEESFDDILDDIEDISEEEMIFINEAYKDIRDKVNENLNHNLLDDVPEIEIDEANEYLSEISDEEISDELSDIEDDDFSAIDDELINSLLDNLSDEEETI